MDFPITDLRDEDACSTKLVAGLHPEGPDYPRCHAEDPRRAQRHHRAPILDFRCGRCGRVFNAFTGTILHGIRRRSSQLVLIMRRIAQGVPIAQRARELDCDRSEVLEIRRLQGAADQDGEILIDRDLS